MDAREKPLQRRAAELLQLARTEHEKEQAAHFLRIVSQDSIADGSASYLLGSLRDASGDRFSQFFQIPPEEAKWFNPSECRLFEFSDAHLFASGVFAAQGTAIDEFIFASQPNWRNLVILAYAASDIVSFDETTFRLQLRGGAPVRTVDGPVFRNSSAWAFQNFGHFIHDFMSQLVYIDEAKALLGGLPSIFMPHSTIRGLRYPIQKFLFEQLVGPLTNLLSLADGESVRVRWLLVGHPTFYLRGGGKAMVSAGAIRYLNRRIRQQFSQFADQASPRNIYVTRDDGVAARHIENEPSVRQALKIHGFTPVTISAHTPSEIIRLFYNAERIAGAHGAGLLNLIFSDSSNVQVLEMQLYPSNWNSIRVFSEALGVAFVGIPATRGAVPGSSGLVDENALTAALERRSR